MTNVDEFEAAAAGAAQWPRTPAVWSYSSLREAEECPRRWSLSRASYPAVWDRPGYPPRPALAAIIGDVVHHVLETVLRAFHGSGCVSRADATAVAVLRELGGYSALARDAIGVQLRRLDTNPRIAPRLESLRAALNQRVPDIRQRVQSVVARMPIAPSPIPTPSDTHASRAPLGPGSYPEVELRAPGLRFVGRADVLTVQPDDVVITDYKTGDPDPHHADQLRTYALLWRRDKKLNPTGRPVTSLVIAYAAHDEVVHAPDPAELDELASALEARIGHAEKDLRLRPPPARPAPEMCRYCAVRHMCEDYWAQLGRHAPIDASADVEFTDREGTIMRRNGPRSWILRLEPADFEVLLRTPTETVPFAAGDRIRLLGVAYGFDDDAEQAVATIMQATETFVLTQ